MFELDGSNMNVIDLDDYGFEEIKSTREVLEEWEHCDDESGR